MTVSYVAYELNDGFIMNWLAGGPQVIPLEGAKEPGFKQQAAAQFYEAKNNISKLPVEPGPLNESTFTVGNFTGQWAYYRCGDDRIVDRSTAQPACCFVRAWAYTQLVSKTDQNGSFELFASGPVDVWLNHKHVFHHEGFLEQLTALRFSADLAKGSNKLTVRFAGVGEPDCVLMFALKVQGEKLNVQIPTGIPSLSRRMEMERANSLVYLDRDVYAAEDRAYLHFPEGLEKQIGADARFRHLSGSIFAQAEDIGKPGQKLFMGEPVTLREGPYQAVVMPRAWEVYDRNIRVETHLNTWVMGRNKFSSSLYGTVEGRKKEALYTASIREDSLFAEIAKMAMAEWDKIEEKVVRHALEQIDRKASGSELLLLGLLGAAARFQDQELFPEWLKPAIASSAEGFRYTGDVAACDGLRFDNPDRLIVFHACAILAGQLYPEAVFHLSQMTGAQHCAEAERKALAWMRARGQHGFVDWNSKTVLAASLIALSHLLDLAESQEVFELGSVLMDKLLFSIASNTVNGIYGVPQGSATSANARSELINELSGITRVLWGMGVFNIHVAGAVSFALLKNYELPLLIAEIAAAKIDELWTLEQQDLGEHPVNLATYRTANTLLASAQDYRPGQAGSREHVWQASLGPQSVIFVNQPANVSDSDVNAPNFWRGNAVLPRAAQWKDTLIALYRSPEDGSGGLSMDMTHAYFPIIEFDEFIQRGNTAFGRKGSGYIALTAAQGLAMVESGKTAFRELRSYGKENVWICRMGQESTDGAFDQFQDQVLGLEVHVDGLSVTCQTLRGDRLQFGWSEPLTRNGETVPLSGYKHFENSFTSTDLPCQQMEIKTSDYLLRLDFGDSV